MGEPSVIISTDDDIAAAIAALQAVDPRLRQIAEIAGAVPLRRNPGGLRGLAGIIVAQQVSKASADAIFRRLCEALDVNDPAAVLAAEDETFRLAGLSRPKQRTLRAIAGAIASGHLDFARIATSPPDEAIAELVAIHGIGLWTAECYLLFSAGHPDVFPAGDLALQAAVAHGLDLVERPKAKALAEIATSWVPHRSVAARLFWAYYGAVARRDVAPTQAQVVSGAGQSSGAPRRSGASAAKAVPIAPLAAPARFTKPTR